MSGGENFLGDVTTEKMLMLLQITLHPYNTNETLWADLDKQTINNGRLAEKGMGYVGIKETIEGNRRRV